MPTLIECPACVRKLRVPDEFLDKKVRCPTCGNTFQAPAQPLPSPLDNSIQDLGPQEIPDEEIPRAQTRRPRSHFRERGTCPGCGEEVPRRAKRCLFCGEEFVSETEDDEEDISPQIAPQRLDCEPHRGGLIQALGIASLVTAFLYLIPIGLPMGITAWIMARRDLKRMERGEMDRAGRGATQTGQVCGLIGTIINFLWLAGCTAILVFWLSAPVARPPRGPRFPPSTTGPGPVFPPPPPIVGPNTVRGPSLQLKGPDLLEIPQGGNQEIIVDVRWLRVSDQPLILFWEDRLPGIQLNPGLAVVKGGDNQPLRFSLQVDADGPLGEHTLRLLGRPAGDPEIALKIKVRVVGPDQD